MAQYSPKTAAEVVELVGAAIAAGTKLAIAGHGSKSSVGVACPEAALLDLSGLAGVVDYDPAELVLTVRPGTPLSDIEALLTANGQMLAFEPFDPARGSPRAATIGGMVAAGLAGSRRLTRGSVRDHLLGFTAVSGRGELFVAGGKVVKNVTGYDLSKLMCGSWGRLAAMTELTLKVLPAPAEELTLVVSGLEPEEARKAMAMALASRAEVAAAAYLPASSGNPSQVLLRLEGIAVSIAARVPILATALGDVELQPGAEAATLWRDIADLKPLDAAANHWRIVLPARAMPRLAAMLEEQKSAWFSDWAGGLVWTDWSGDPGKLRTTVEQVGGHAMLVKASDEIRNMVPALHPQSLGVARLEERVRRAFDPSGVFETSRFGGRNAN